MPRVKKASAPEAEVKKPLTLEDLAALKQIHGTLPPELQTQYEKLVKK